MSEYRVAPAEGPYKNRLIASASPYLVQHANNPVDWYEWGPEALERARAEDKPILVSVGYAACHWCHVMAHESFEDPTTATLMNELFICIKVDREERPDIDSVYMSAVQAMTGQGGWPMNAFCLADGTPFYGGTYFPPEAKARRYNMASWPQVLRSVAEAYRTRRAEIVESGRELVAHLNRIAEAPTNNMFNFPPVRELITSAIDQLSLQYDAAEGGFGGAPKFPQPMTLEFLLRAHLRGDERALPMLINTLRKMAWGGMYDQVGGGFHRYSVDARWLVPHFEKMLYDNGLLARLYVEAYQVTGEQDFRRVAVETLDYILREMRHEQGGFYSTQDADSLPYPGAPHAEEGVFYVWTPDEIREHLGEDAMLFGQLFAVTRQGNFEGRNILNLPRDPNAVARVTGASPERLQAVIERGREKLYAARARRPAPFRDEKIIVAWNGMTIRALVSAALACERPDYLAAAQQCADFLLTQMRRPDGRLLRSWKDGRPGPLGFLEDHAQLLDALLALHAADGDARWLREAIQTAETTVALFWDAQADVLYDTAADQEALVTRPRDIGDNAVPSGTSVATEAFLRLTALTGADVYRDRARKLLNGLGPMMIRFPQGFGRLLCAADLYAAPIVELALVGAPEAEDTQELLKVALGSYRPQLVVARSAPGDNSVAAITPLLAQRELIDGKATAYVCRKFVCELPVTDPAALQARLTQS